MPEFVDLYEVSSRVSEISLKFATSQCEEYQRTRDATEHIMAAKEAADAKTRDDHLQDALEAMADARPEVPEEYLADWDDCRERLEEANDAE